MICGSLVVNQSKGTHQRIPTAPSTIIMYSTCGGVVCFLFWIGKHRRQVGRARRLSSFLSDCRCGPNMTARSAWHDCSLLPWLFLEWHWSLCWKAFLHCWPVLVHYHWRSLSSTIHRFWCWWSPGLYPHNLGKHISFYTVSPEYSHCSCT